MFKKLLLISVFVITLHAGDEEINHLPFDYMNVQYAGQIGFISIGGGNTFFDDHYDFELYLGLTPRLFYISEVAIVTLAVKNNYIPYTLKYESYEFRPYIGLGILFAQNQRYDPNWQDSIDDSYYYQNNWHITGNIGLTINKNFSEPGIRSLGLYIESMTNDVYFLDYYHNREALTIDDVFSTAFGLRIGF